MVDSDTGFTGCAAEDAKCLRNNRNDPSCEVIVNTVACRVSTSMNNPTPPLHFYITNNCEVTMGMSLVGLCVIIEPHSTSELYMLRTTEATAADVSCRAFCHAMYTSVSIQTTMHTITHSPWKLCSTTGTFRVNFVWPNWYNSLRQGKGLENQLLTFCVRTAFPIGGLHPVRKGPCSICSNFMLFSNSSLTHLLCSAAYLLCSHFAGLIIALHAEKAKEAVTRCTQLFLLHVYCNSYYWSLRRLFHCWSKKETSPTSDMATALQCKVMLHPQIQSIRQVKRLCLGDPTDLNFDPDHS